MHKRMHRVRRLLVISFLVFPVFVGIPALAGMSDLARHWSAEVVAALLARGIAVQSGPNTFAPDAALTRGQFAEMLGRGLELDQDAALLARFPSRFSDVQSGRRELGYVETLAEHGILAGYPDGTFHPDATMSRGELIVTLVRAVGQSELARTLATAPLTVTDAAQVPAWAHGAVAVAMTQGYIHGFEDGSLQFDRLTTRAEGAVVLLRMLSVRGNLYALSGTLLSWDPGSGTGIVRMATGEEQKLVMSPDATYFRNGQAGDARGISVMDEVWAAGTPAGLTFLSATYRDGLCLQPKSEDEQNWSCAAGSSLQGFRVRPETLLYFNGQPGRPEQLAGAGQAYVVLYAHTGEARAVDVVFTNTEGSIVTSNLQRLTIRTASGSLLTVKPAEDIQIFRYGLPVTPQGMQPGDFVRLLVVDGKALYGQVMSP